MTARCHQGWAPEGIGNATVSYMDQVLLREHLESGGEPAYRVAQVWQWAARGVTGYAEMSNLPAELREGLAIIDEGLLFGDELID